VLVQHLVSSLSLGDCSDHRLREDVNARSTKYKNSSVLLLFHPLVQALYIQHLLLKISHNFSDKDVPMAGGITY